MYELRKKDICVKKKESILYMCEVFLMDFKEVFYFCKY